MQVQNIGSGNNNMVRNLGMSTKVELKMIDTSGFTVRKLSGEKSGGAASANVPALDKGANPLKINLLA